MRMFSVLCLRGGGSYAWDILPDMPATYQNSRGPLFVVLLPCCFLHSTFCSLFENRRQTSPRICRLHVHRL